jgi:hypothetical protein
MFQRSLFGPSCTPAPRRACRFAPVLFHWQKIKFTAGKYDFTSQFLFGQSKAIARSAKSASLGAVFGIFASQRLIALSPFGLGPVNQPRLYRVGIA